MKEDFLTIPDAPNYEINSQLVCRNKKTGHIKSLMVVPNVQKFYVLYAHGRRILLSPKTLRRQAVSGACKHREKFVPIVCFASGRYEINRRGKVRNAKTKHVLKPVHGCVCLCDDTYKKWYNVKTLLWEAHGIIPKSYHHRTGVIISRDGFVLRFDSCKACARYLAPKISYAFDTVAKFLYKRRDEICGWKVSYEEAS